MKCKIIKLYKQGLSCREVAKKVGCEKSYVYLVVKEAKVNRSKKEAQVNRTLYPHKNLKSKRKQSYSKVTNNMMMKLK